MLIRQLSAAAIIIFLSAGTFAQPAKSKKPNVLFIIADDLRPELGAYGVSAIKTPHIDKIAARGTRFDNAYAQWPVCNPSRASFLTGRYPTQTGVMNNNDYFRRKHPDFITLPQYFKQHGYASLRTGKIFHGGIDDQVSWTEGGEPVDSNITERGNPNLRRAAPQPSSAEEGTRASSSDRIIVLEGNGETHGDYRTATRAIDFLDRYKDKPFFLAVGFVKPHSPPSAPQKFFDLYDVDRIGLPVDFDTIPRAPVGLPAISIASRNSDLFIGRVSPPALSREMKRAYYASTSFMDEQVGRVMEALKRNNLEENTIVVFFGDHGYHLGEKGKWSKAYSLYELGLRVPLIIALPKGKGQYSTQVVELVDLYKTLAELCALPEPQGVEGNSFSSLLKNPQARWNNPAYSIVEYQRKTGKSVRTKEWHYVEWDEGAAGAMLFKHPDDPHELKNLADDPKYSAVVTDMKKLLKKFP
jgi:iduronate 2-sulfatase